MKFSRRVLPFRAASTIALLAFAIGAADSQVGTQEIANGGGTFPGVPPGTYYLMISAMYNKQSLVWEQAQRIDAGRNSITLDQRNPTSLN